MVIIDHGLQTLTHEVIVPHSGWEREPNEDSKPRDAEWTTVFKNTSGCLRCGQRWGIGQICRVTGACPILGDSEPHPKSLRFPVVLSSHPQMESCGPEVLLQGPDAGHCC